jgi:hypothetical protein
VDGDDVEEDDGDDIMLVSWKPMMIMLMWRWVIMVVMTMMNDDTSWHLLIAYMVWLIFTLTKPLRGGYHYNPQFIDKETDAHRG